MLRTNPNMKHVVWRVTLLAIIPFSGSLLALIAHAVIPRNIAESPAEVSAQTLPAAADTSIAAPFFVNASFQRDLEDSEEPEPPIADTSLSDSEIRTELTDQDERPRPLTAKRRLPINLSRVDRLIREGNFPFAIDLLEEFKSGASGLLHVQIQFRLGLCSELIGDPDSALTHYRAITEAHQSTSVADAATCAAARVLIELGRRDVGNGMLMRLLLSRERSMRKDIEGDLVHTLARGLTPAAENPSLLDDSQWLTATYQATPETLLKSWMLLDVRRSTTTRHSPLSLRVLTSSPEGILASLQLRTATVSKVLLDIADELNWSVEFAESSRGSLKARTTIFDCEELPLDVILDSLLKPNGFGWKYSNEQLLVFPQAGANISAANVPSTLQKHVKFTNEELETADRFQQLAVNLAPDHPAAPASYVLLGTTAAHSGNMDDAVRAFETSADLFPRAPSLGATMFNLGKASLLRGNRDAALKHFYKTVDRVSGLETDAAAYLYAGRILLENDTAKRAISPLTRGLSLCENTKYEPEAALLLSAAYLMSGNVAGANTILFDHQAAFEYKEEDTNPDANRLRKMAQQAALVSSLARFWGSRGRQRIREGRALLSALTNVRADDMFGQHAAYLVGVAFSEVGLDFERDAVFRKSLAAAQSFPLQRRMSSLMNGEISKDETLNLSFSSQPGQSTATGHSARTNVVTAQSILAESERAYRNGDHDKVVKSCSDFLRAASSESRAEGSGEISADDQSVRKSMLRLMGMAFQAKGQHAQAVRCFAGVLPAGV